MFSRNEQKAQPNFLRSPSRSPPSSPACIDSSPPASPFLEPLFLDQSHISGESIGTAGANNFASHLPPGLSVPANWGYAHSRTPSAVQPHPEALSHPLAASFNANRALPLYEKQDKQIRHGLQFTKDGKGREVRPPVKKVRYMSKEKEKASRDDTPTSQVVSEPKSTPVQREESLWDTAVQLALTTGSKSIDLKWVDLSFQLHV